MVEANKLAPPTPFNSQEWAARHSEITADDLPRLIATIDAIGPTLAKQALDQQPILRLLAGFVVRNAIPLGPFECTLRTAFIAKVPQRFNLEMLTVKDGVRFLVKDREAKKIIQGI